MRKSFIARFTEPTRMAKRLIRLAKNNNALIRFIKYLLKTRLVSAWLNKNALDLRTAKLELYFSNLPAAFDGYRILHMSDLHIDGQPRLAKILKALLDTITADVAIISGDFHLYYTKGYDLCKAL